MEFNHYKKKNFKISYAMEVNVTLRIDLIN